MALPCPAHVLPWLAFVSRLVRFVALKRHRSVSDWHMRGETPPRSNCSKNIVFCSASLCPVGCGSPFSPGSGVFDPLRSRTLLAHQAPTRRPTRRNSTATLSHQSTVTNRSRHLSDVSSSSEHAGLFRPRLGSFTSLHQRASANVLLQLIVPRYMTAWLASSNEACRPSERVTSTWDSWSFAA